jgi:ubiquinone/menaquinone biosynthesis C-methylase UbiE
MDARLQRRVQRYGWDRAAAHYETLWQRPLAGVQAALLQAATVAPGEAVLDVACGTGLVSFAAAEAAGPTGRVLGIDLSEQMVEAARGRALQRAGRAALGAPLEFLRMDAEQLVLPAAGFDVVLCALGLMYLPEPARALQEMQRVLRPGGRVALAVWGERARCGWAPLFPIVDAEVASEVCPLFFQLGQGEALARLCQGVGLQPREQRRLSLTLDHADADEACDAALLGGPVALAWSRLDEAARQRVRSSYRAAIEPWRVGSAYRIAAEFVVVTATSPGPTALTGR